jgi:hypothetical protein
LFISLNWFITKENCPVWTDWCLIVPVESFYRGLAQLLAFFGNGLAILFLIACSGSKFERQNEHAVRENPAGVELEIRTRGGREQFAQSEPVLFEEIYTSKFPGLWHIEILDSWNEAADSEIIHITDGNAIWEKPWMYAIICCDSRHVWLSLDPVRLPYKLFANRTSVNPEGWVNPEWYTLQLPNKPGKYLVYVTSARVFGYTSSTATYHGKGVPVSSNVLKLEIK